MNAFEAGEDQKQESDDEEQKQESEKWVYKKKKRRANKDERGQNVVKTNFQCEVCKNYFPSKSKLFKHLKKTGIQTSKRTKQIAFGQFLPTRAYTVKVFRLYTCTSRHRR